MKLSINNLYDVCNLSERKYPSLCAACENPACDAQDRYWGASGALSCLVDGAGDVMWGELGDVVTYFGVSGGFQGKRSSIRIVFNP